MIDATLCLGFLLAVFGPTGATASAGYYTRDPANIRHSFHSHTDAAKLQNKLAISDTSWKVHLVHFELQPNALNENMAMRKTKDQVYEDPVLRLRGFRDGDFLAAQPGFSVLSSREAVRPCLRFCWTHAMRAANHSGC